MSAERAEKRMCAFEAFTTLVCVHAYGDEDACEAAFARTQVLCEEYEALFSRTRKGSDVWKLNAACGGKVGLDARTIDLLAKAKTYCARGEGLFDVTVGPYVGLWDFKNGHVANPSELERVSDSVGWQAIGLDGCAHARLERPGAAVDLGGIAKGWIADALDEELSSFGLDGFVIDIGGNVIVGGRKPDGEPWKIGVRDPRKPMHSIAATSLERGSVVTSGVYERCFARDGRLYHHVLDPATGMPAKTDLLSATLVCDRSIDAEGYSTTVLALGVDRAREYVRSIPEIRCALLIGADMNLIAC